MIIFLHLTVATFLLHLGASGASTSHAHFFDEGDDYEEPVLCDIEADYSSPYVKAFKVSDVDTRSCRSRFRNEQGREVHVVHLLGGKGRRRERLLVHLYISSLINQGHFKGKAIIVLLSDRPVEWKIHSEGIGNSTRQHIQLTNDSRLIKDEQLSLKIKKFARPATNDTLVWAQNQFGSVTSYQQASNANLVQIHLGTDEKGTTRCEVQPTIVRNSLHMSVQEKQITSGCAARWNENINQRDGHVIEVDGVEGPVQIDITAISPRPVQRSVRLLLKSHQSTHYHVRAHGMVGEIMIITDNNQVTNDLVADTLYVLGSVYEKDLANVAKRELLEWARDSYGAPVTYTNANGANKFVLYVDGGEKANLSTLPPQPAVDDMEGEAVVDEEIDAATADGLRGANTQQSLTSLLNFIQQEKIVSCKKDKLFVSLLKAPMFTLGISAEQLSFNDEKCIATDNGTHYLLNSFATNCKTQLYNSTTFKQYRNDIVLHLKPPLEEEEIEGSADWISEESSGHGSNDNDDSTMLDDEDFTRSKTNSVYVVCDETSQQKAVTTDTGPYPQVHFSLQLYLDRNFSKPIGQGGAVLQEEQNLYARVNMTKESGYKLIIDRCCVTTTLSNTALFNDVPQELIKKECKQQEFVKILESTDTERKFQFEFNANIRGHDLYQYLRCDVGLCSPLVPLRSPDIPTCFDNTEHFCLVSQMKNKNPQLRSHTLHVGPLIMNYSNAPGKPNCNPDYGTTEPIHDEIVEEDVSAGQCLRVAGLDSGTVIGIAFAAFIIGVMLTAALWYIHTHTGPMSRGRMGRLRSAETSGESTPSSTAPITIHQVNHH